MERVLVGLYQSVKLSFMTVGHTKFAPDWCFGLLKQKFRRTKVDCLEDIVNVVESSASVNNAQLVGTQSGETVVKSYDWAGYFASKLKRVPQIKKQHHFVFTSSKPGIVTMKEFTDTETTELRLPKDPPPLCDKNSQSKYSLMVSHLSKNGICMRTFGSFAHMKPGILCAHI